MTVLKAVTVSALSVSLLAFSGSPSPEKKSTHDTEDTAATQKAREAMVREQLSARGIEDERVLRAMGKIPRHLFVKKSLQGKAYNDHPLPIGEGQTISQPYVVALMSESLTLEPSDRVLEIGTGSGYQAAVLSEIVKEVYTMEIRKSLSREASLLLDRLGYGNVETKYGDGYFGWEKHAPYDAIMVTASANHIPPPLLKQLKVGGELIIPLGNTLFYQVLTLVTKEAEDVKIRQMGGVSFVPMVGEVRKRKEEAE